MLNAYRTAIGAVLALSLCSPALAAPAETCAFGECGPYVPTQSSVPSPVVASPEPAPSGELRKISEHGSWSAMTDGHVTILIGHFQDGSEFGLLTSGDGKGDLLFHDPKWTLKVGTTFDIRIEVDGHAFTGTVIASDEKTLKLEDVTKDFVTAIYNGQKATIKIDRYEADITTLPDAAATLDDAVRYRQTSAR